MEADFWHARWQKNEIGFHEAQGSHLLKAHIGALSLNIGARVFVPLCGKTRDIAWLLSRGFSVVAIELNDSAVQQLLDELGVDATPALCESPQNTDLNHYHKKFENGLNLDVYQGDFFEITVNSLGKIDAVYDRAALVALPFEMRVKYTAHLRKVTHNIQQLLVCYEYEEGLLKGPPHNISADEVDEHYRAAFNIECLYKSYVEGGFRGRSDVFEAVYLVHPK